MFDALWARGRDWLPQLLALPSGGCEKVNRPSGDLMLTEGYWEPNEKGLAPPVALLSWLIRNVWRVADVTLDGERQKFTTGDPEVIERALRLLRSDPGPRGWHLFEGPTYPDVLLVARDALVVIEGKRTEPAPTTRTKWLPGRHQMWRHLDAAWEMRGHRAVYGFFIVESLTESQAGAVPETWRRAALDCASPTALQSSFPHRSRDEVDAISACFLGVTTWRHMCEQFGIDPLGLPHQV